jgi:hypothetical protein
VLLNGPDKRLEQLGAGLRSTHYKFTRVHQTSRVTPVMEVWIAKSVWTLKEIVGWHRRENVVNTLKCPAHGQVGPAIEKMKRLRLDFTHEHPAYPKVFPMMARPTF